MANDVELTVGNGPVTKAGIYGQVLAGLTAVAGVIQVLATTLGTVSADPVYGVYLTVGAGVVGAAIQMVTGLSRARFADAKAKIIAGQGAEAYQVIYEDLAPGEVVPPIEDPTEPTDTNTPPPVEPR
jgi:hypothetical protein